MQFSIILGLFVLGTLLGSFYNVVAYRLTKGESIIYPSSHCPNCNHKLIPYELIPIVSFILQNFVVLSTIRNNLWSIICSLLYIIWPFQRTDHRAYFCLNANNCRLK